MSDHLITLKDTSRGARPRIRAAGIARDRAWVAAERREAVDLANAKAEAIKVRDEREDAAAFPGLTIATRIMAREICAKWGLRPSLVSSRTRKVPVTHCRQAIIYEIAARTDWSLTTIGRRMGGYNHTTMLHAIKAHAARNGLPPARGGGGAL